MLAVLVGIGEEIGVWVTAGIATRDGDGLDVKVAAGVHVGVEVEVGVGLGVGVMVTSTLWRPGDGHGLTTKGHPALPSRARCKDCPSNVVGHAGLFTVRSVPQDSASRICPLPSRKMTLSPVFARPFPMLPSRTTTTTDSSCIDASTAPVCATMRASPRGGMVKSGRISVSTLSEMPQPRASAGNALRFSNSIHSCAESRPGELGL